MIGTHQTQWCVHAIGEPSRPATAQLVTPQASPARWYAITATVSPAIATAAAIDPRPPPSSTDRVARASSPCTDWLVELANSPTLCVSNRYFVQNRQVVEGTTAIDTTSVATKAETAVAASRKRRVSSR